MQKNAAGGWLRKRLLDRAFSAGMLLMVFTGCGLGFAIGNHPVFDGRLGTQSTWAIWAAVVLSAGGLYVFTRKWEASWGVGLAAERKVGDLIEHALTQDDCAYAHDVKEALGIHGNIDHVVMTPRGVWVVETKARWLSTKKFSAARHQIGKNVRRVRQHLGTSLPASLPVRGALVIGDPSHDSLESDHDWNEVQIKAFGAKSFWKALRHECAHGPDNSLHPGVTTATKMVWNLGSAGHVMSDD